MTLNTQIRGVTAAPSSYEAEVANAVLPDFDDGEKQGWRDASRARFLRAGLPSRRLENWRYTDLKKLLRDFPAPVPAVPDLPDWLRSECNVERPGLGSLVFVDGAFCPELSRLDPDRSAGIRWKLAAPDALNRETESWRNMPATPLACGGALDALNAAFVRDGLHLRVEAGCCFAEPLNIITVATTATPQSLFERCVIQLEAGSALTIVNHIGLGTAAAAHHYHRVVDIDIAEAASLHNLTVDCDAEIGFHATTTQARLARGGTCELMQLALGGAVTRYDLQARLDGADAMMRTATACLLDGHRHCDVTAAIDHHAPSGRSEALFRGALDGHARAVFQGLLHVGRAADDTDALQRGAALLLSPDAEFDTKPRLDILTDNVRCAHGATVGALDPEQVFYCRARGLDEAMAHGLLVAGFLNEAFVDAPPPLAAMARDLLAARLGNLSIAAEGSGHA